MNVKRELNSRESPHLSVGTIHDVRRRTSLAPAPLVLTFYTFRLLRPKL